MIGLLDSKIGEKRATMWYIQLEKYSNTCILIVQVITDSEEKEEKLEALLNQEKEKNCQASNKNTQASIRCFKMDEGLNIS